MDASLITTLLGWSSQCTAGLLRTIASTLQGIADIVDSGTPDKDSSIDSRSTPSAPNGRKSPEPTSSGKLADPSSLSAASPTQTDSFQEPPSASPVDPVPNHAATAEGTAPLEGTRDRIAETLLRARSSLDAATGTGSTRPPFPYGRGRRDR